MKRKISIFFLVILCVLVSVSMLTACDFINLGHTHIYSDSWTNDQTYHWHECACGETSQKLEHSFEDGLCVCGYEDPNYVPPQHIHVCNILKKDQNKHWLECECGYSEGTEDHKGGTATCIKRACCEICGEEYGDLAEHIYNELENDQTEHWYECWCGAKIENEEHSGGTATCKQLAVCDICNNYYGEYSEHDYSIIEPQYKGHYYICSCCSRTTDIEEHNYVDGICSVCNYEWHTEGLVFNLLDDDTYSVGIYCDAIEVFIPATYLGKPVTEINGTNCYYMEKIILPSSILTIGDNAFSHCENLTEINLPDSVLTIGDSAFYDCISLTEIDLPENLKSIGSGAFSCCERLTSLEIPNSVSTIGEYAFVYCELLETVSFEEGISITEIPGMAFDNCSSLKSIDIPDSVVSIGERAFSSCESLEQITFGENSLLTKIESQAFYNCELLEKIDIPLMVEYIGEDAFSFCKSLSTIDFKDNSAIATIQDKAFASCYSLKEVTFGNNSRLTSLGNSVFVDCGLLENVDFGEDSKLKDIGEYAFESCKELKDIEIPSQITRLERRTFYGCKALESVAFAEGCNLTIIDEEVFVGCYELKQVIIPASVIAIGNSAFNECGSLSAVTIEENSNLTSIGDYAFRGCGDFEYIKIPKSVVTIGDCAFYSCRALTGVEFEQNSNLKHIGDSAFCNSALLENINLENCNQLESIGYCAFQVTSLCSVKIPKSVARIGSFAFSICTSLTSIEVDSENKYYTSIDGNLYNKNATILIQYSVGKTQQSFTVPMGVLCIGERAFYECRSLTSIELPDSVETILGEAFVLCESLAYIKLSNNLTSIGEYAFADCIALTSIQIPSSVNYIATNAFYYNSDKESVLSEINVDKNNPNYSSIDGSLYNKKATELIFYAPFNTQTTFTVPSSVTKIGDYAFSAHNFIENVELPNGLLIIGEKAFYECEELKNIVIPDSVATIEDLAFEYSGIRTIELSNNLTSVGSGVFSACFFLEYNEKDGLNYLGNDSNKYLYLVGPKSDKITTATIADTCKIIGEYAFAWCQSLVNVKIPSSVISICGDSFNYCDSLENVYFMGTVDQWAEINFDCSPMFYADKLYINNKLLVNAVLTTATKISDYAFSNCQSLKSIQIPSTVTSIGDFAFAGCTSLTSIEIPSTVTSIGDSAFAGCTSLTSIEIPDSVTSIGEDVFSNCDSLVNLEIPDNLEIKGTIYYLDSLQYNVKDGLMYLGNDSNKYIHLVGVVSDQITTAVIDENCRYIGDRAFYGWNSLLSIYIPDSVIKIGEFAFYDCSSLTSVTFGENSQLTSIDYGAFANCTSLERIVVPNGVTSIGANAFSGCSALVEVKLSENLTDIDGYAFSDCLALNSIIIPNTLTFIAQRAFDGCESLIIYCEAYVPAQGYNTYWSGNRIVLWAGQWEMIYGVPTPIN